MPDLGILRAHHDVEELPDTQRGELVVGRVVRDDAQTNSVGAQRREGFDEAGSAVAREQIDRAVVQPAGT